MRTKTLISAASALLIGALASAASAAVFTAGSVTVVTDPVVVTAGSNSGAWALLAPTEGSQSLDVKVIMPGTGFTLDDTNSVATYTYSFDARFTGFKGVFEGDFSVQAPDGDKPFVSFIGFGGNDPKGVDNTWHHYSTTFSTRDTDVAGGTADRFLITDYYIFNISNGNQPGNIFTAEIDNLSILGPDGEHLLPQVGVTVNNNSHLDNGDNFATTTYGQTVNGSFRNQGQSFTVVPEPAGIVLIGALGTAAMIRRRRTR